MMFNQITLGAAMLILGQTNALASHKDSDSCSIGRLCVLSGTAIVNPRADGEQSWLEMDRSCVALSLPEYVYANRNHWDGKRVRVAGTAYRQPKGKFLYYDIAGKRISAGVCERNPLMIVDDIKLQH